MDLNIKFLLDDFENYEKYTNSYFTEEEKQQYVDCLKILWDQDHSGTTIVFTIDKWIALLKNIKEDKYFEEINNQIEQYSKEKDGYLDIMIMEYIYDLVEICKNIEVAKLVKRYIDFNCIGPIKLKDEDFEICSEDLAQHKHCWNIFRTSKGYNVSGVVIFDIFDKNNKYETSVTIGEQYDPIHNIHINSTLKLNKNTIFLKYFHIRCREDKDGNFILFHKDVKKYKNAVKYYGDN